LNRADYRFSFRREVTEPRIDLFWAECTSTKQHVKEVNHAITS